MAPAPAAAETPAPAGLRLDRACPLCAGRRPQRLEKYSPDGWDVVRCGACGMVYLRNPPPAEAYEEDFAWEKTSAEKKKQGGSTALSGLNRSLRAKTGTTGGRRGDRRYPEWFGAGRVLDIGCGDRIRTRPPIVPYGIELSTALHARADAAMREQGGYCLHASGAEGVWQYDEGFFDGAILHSYLEHEEEPLQVLRGLHRALKPGGKAFVRVPNFGSLNRRVIGPTWCGFRYPDHVNYFTWRTLRKMAAAAGFGARLVNRANLWVDDNIQALLLREGKA